MPRFLLVAAAALALSFAAPSQACENCKDCPHAKAASAEKAAKPDKKEVAKGCPCGEGKECKCGAKCDCPHCHGAKAAPKAEEKKT
jgi:hypothetical protein